MGNAQSIQQFPAGHVRIYSNLIQIQEPRTRVEMIRTLLVGQEYVASARAAGIYSHLLSYIAKVQAGERPLPLPGEMAMSAVTYSSPPQAERQQAERQQAPPAQHPRSIGGHPSQMAITQFDPAGGIRPTVQQRPSQVVTKGRRNEKALNYFQSCLQVLGLEEEVALTEDALKRAYKRAAIKAHPDKGGSEEEFEAITRAHAYLGEILLRVKGGRKTEGKMEAPEALKDNRQKDSKQWEMVQPVRLNPKKLDLNAFNQMFEQTRMPDPDEEGYGDWLKSADGSDAGPKFSGKFNRDVFNRAFEEEAAKRRGGAGSELALRQPDALTLAPTAGVELGRGRPETYTAAPNANLKFTDLKSAYTAENMITNQVADVVVENRSFDKYSAQWKQAPKPLADHEMAAVAAAEQAAARREQQRQLRAAEEGTLASQYFERMKRLVITNN
jgi:curved DNA-binding protein CbpA